MNARQMKKHLKKQIDKLQSENSLMRKIIEDTPEMREFIQPLNITHTTLPFKKFKAKRIIPEYLTDIEGIIENTKQAVTLDLLEGIKENIEENVTYEIDIEHRPISITGSIFIGNYEKLS